MEPKRQPAYSNLYASGSSVEPEVILYALLPYARVKGSPKELLLQRERKTALGYIKRAHGAAIHHTVKP